MFNALSFSLGDDKVQEMMVGTVCILNRTLVKKGLKGKFKVVYILP